MLKFHEIKTRMTSEYSYNYEKSILGSKNYS